MMIYASKSDGSHGFGRLFPSLPIIEEEVPQGLYNFYGMTFSTSSGLISEKCSKATAFLSGNLNQVTLDFQEVTCAESDFLGSDPALNTGSPAVTFSTTSLEFCDSVQGITTGADRCTDNLADEFRVEKRGSAMSAKVSLMAFEKAGGKTVTGTSLDGGCLNVSPTDLRGLSPTNVSNFLPAGDGATTPFLTRFEIYANSTNCTIDTPYVLDLQNGLAVNNGRAKQIVIPGSPGSPATRKIFIKMSGNEICQGDNLTADFAGGTGLAKSPKLICNESQLYNIFPAMSTIAAYTANANFSYKLLRDIDLSDNPVIGGTSNPPWNPPWASCVLAGLNFMPIGTIWDGSACSNATSAGIHFFGNNKTIKGMRIIKSTNFSALYLMTDQASGQDSYFQNLNIADSTFIAGSYAGSLVAHSTRSSFENITLDNVYVTSTTGSYTGGLIGESFGTPINNVHGTDLTVIGLNYVGGLAGQTHRAYSNSTMTNIFDSSIRGTITGNSHVGGLVGNLGQGSVVVGQVSTNFYQSYVKRSSFVGDITANTNIGGIAGQAYTTRIVNSYARTNFSSPATTSVHLGGLVGYMKNKLTLTIGGIAFDSGIYSSYTMLSLDSCGAAGEPACPSSMGTVIGSTDSQFGASDFETVAYPLSDFLSTATTAAYGSSQDDTSFMSATPGWSVSIMNFFPNSVWNFSDTAYPSLIGEPNP